MQQKKNSESTYQSSISDPYQFLDIDFELTSNPQKYLDDVQNCIKKHSDLSDHLQRLILKTFEDVEQEQILTDFHIQYPREMMIYSQLAIQYNQF